MREIPIAEVGGKDVNDVRAIEGQRMSHADHQKESQEQCFAKRHAPLYLTGAYRSNHEYLGRQRLTMSVVFGILAA